MSIQDLKDSQIADNIRRYRERGMTEGGPYSLAELLEEQARRNPTPFEVEAVVEAIIQGSRSSIDGYVTFGDLWKNFKDEPFVGNHAQQQVGNALGRVAHYCRRNNLPYLTTLVVQSATRTITEEARNNIFNTARELGYETGNDRDKFIDEQREKSKALAQVAT